jgi:hypothetical protein
MTTAKRLFENNLSNIEVISVLYDYFLIHLPAIDLTELLRAQYVMIVSAFDYYIHNLVRENILDIFYDASKKIPNIKISLNIVNVLLQESNKDEQRRILDTEVKNILSRYSYQSSINVENAMGLIGVRKIWSKIASNLNQSSEDIKNRLNLIVNRRNKIAHESDINFITGAKECIDKAIVIDTIDFLKRLVNEIDRLR